MKLLEHIENYAFEILFASCIIFVIIFSIYRKIKGEKGTWSRYHRYPPTIKQNYIPRNRQSSSGKQPSSGKQFSQGKESKGETECRHILEQTFKKKFDKIRPNFLKNPVTKNFNLELDCYNDDLKLALEYNGAQHYKYTPYFHKNKESFLNQQYRDELKRRMCEDNGITLIEVPYTVKNDQLEPYIMKKLSKYGYI